MNKLIVVAMLSPSLAYAETTELGALESEAKAKINAFGQQLKATLTAALAEGGAQKGLGACQLAAPAIAIHHSTEGWRVGRTSLKTRNHGNMPDSWEKQQLTRFEKAKDDGQPVSQLAYSEITVNQQGERVFRMIKAIPTGEPCLMCHGSEIAPPVRAMLDDLYPDDKAIGFHLGDIRGAFSVSKALN